MRPLLRLFLTLGVCAGILSMNPNSFMLFAVAGAAAIALARYMGHDVTGVPAIDVVFPVWITICVYTICSYQSGRPALDQYMLALDQKIGATWIFGRLFAQYPLLELVCGIAYGILPLVWAALYLFIPEPGNRARLWWSGMVSTASCCIGYTLFPAAGPKYAFATTWPFSEPQMLHPHPAAVQGALNCMPSGHLMAALLFFWFSKTCHKSVRVAYAVFVALTFMATLGLGEHYWTDLIASVPIAYMVYRIGQINLPDSKRLTVRMTELCEQAKQTALSAFQN